MILLRYRIAHVDALDNRLEIKNTLDVIDYLLKLIFNARRRHE